MKFGCGGLVDTPPGVTCKTQRRGDRSCFAARAFRKGETILTDIPLMVAQLQASAERVQACAHCLRYVGTLQSQLAYLSGTDVSALPGVSDKDSQFSPVVPCRSGCGLLYCSAECEAQAAESHHLLLCDGAAGVCGEEDAPYRAFREHARRENESFHLAGIVLASVIATADTRGVEDAMAPYLRLCSGPWWDLVAVPADVPERKHAAYRARLRKIASDSLSLLRRAATREGRLEGGRKDAAAATLTLDVFGSLVGSLLLNSLCVDLPSPVKQYLEALSESGGGEGGGAVDAKTAEMCQAMVQLQQELQARDEMEEAEDGISLSGDEEDSESEDGGSSESEDETVSDMEAPRGVRRNIPLLIEERDPQPPSKRMFLALKTALVASKEGSAAATRQRRMAGVEAAAEAAPDVEGTAVFPLISMINHSCRPNASVEFLDVHGREASIVAVRDIAQGEQLSISYINDDDMPELERRVELKDYQFECRCDRCKDERCAADRAAKTAKHEETRSAKSARTGEDSPFSR